jgi:small subunit ribosomal protein S13
VARIAGVDLPKKKRMDIALTYIYGIGRTTARKILADTGVEWTKSTDDLSADETNTIRNEIEQRYKVEGDLRRELTQNIKRLMDIGCYRGLRHRKGLPARGQRTHTNARTRKGPRRSLMGKKKSKAPAAGGSAA